MVGSLSSSGHTWFILFENHYQQFFRNYWYNILWWWLWAYTISGENTNSYLVLSVPSVWWKFIKENRNLVSFMVSILKIPVRSGRYPPAVWEFMANVYRDWKNWMFRAIDRQEKSSAYNGFLFPLAERQLIPTQSLHHQILEFLDLHLVLGVQVLTSLPRVIWTWMEKLLCWLNKKKIIKKKTQIGSQGHSYHRQRRLPFMNNLLENCPLVMDVASLRLSSMVIFVIVVLL